MAEREPQAFQVAQPAGPAALDAWVQLQCQHAAAGPGFEPVCEPVAALFVLRLLSDTQEGADGLAALTLDLLSAPDSLGAAAQQQQQQPADPLQRRFSMPIALTPLVQTR